MPEGRALLFTEARTANTFAETPVSDEELASIWELAKWAPTSANTQPLRVLYVRPGEGRDRLAKHMSEGNRAKTATAPAVAVLAVDTRFHEHIPAVFPIRAEMKDYFEAQEETAVEARQLQRDAPGGLLHPGGPRPRPGRGPDDRLRRGRA